AAAGRMSVLGDRRDSNWSANPAVQIRVAMIAFHNTPTIIAAVCNDVYFFPGSLTYVRRVELASYSIKREPPGIPHSICKDFVGACGRTEERIRTRRRIWNASVWVVDVDSKYLAKKTIDVLSPIPRVIPGTAIAHRNIKESVRSKFDHSSVVIGERLLDSQNYSFRRISHVGIG